jgi:hypothetical protein
LLQEEREQKFQFEKLMQIGIVRGHVSDDKYWLRIRNELLWLRSWGAEELTEGADTGRGKGIFGKLSKEFIEVELLKVLLQKNRRFPPVHGESHFANLIWPCRYFARAVNLRDFARLSNIS